MSGPVVVRVGGFVGVTNQPDLALAQVGRWLAEYNPTTVPITFVTTSDLAEALRFPTAGEAFAAVMQPSGRPTRRPDGMPDRPITAYTLEMIPLADAAAEAGL